MLLSRNRGKGEDLIHEPAFIFDLDGVIVHSTPLHIKAWEIYLRRHAIEIPPGTIETKMLGKHNRDCVIALFGGGLSEDVIVRHGRDKEALYRELMAPRLEEFLVPGLKDFLARHASLPLAVASNAEPANVDFVLEGASLLESFAVVINGHQVKKPKPNPEVFLTAARRLGVRPSGCVIFEDSTTGVQAARAAGAKVVGLTTTDSNLQDCDLTVSNFQDPKLEAWLAQFTPAAI